MDHQNQSSGGRGWLIGVACFILVIWMLNHNSSSSPSNPSVSGDQTPTANSTEIVPNAESPPPENIPKTFAGDECTGDCSGHEAGYRWAEEHDIDNEDDCDTAGDTSNSPSFAEGCKAYVNGDSPDEDDNDGSGKPSDSDDDPQGLHRYGSF
jgi:hypothetical protein